MGSKSHFFIVQHLTHVYTRNTLSASRPVVPTRTESQDVLPPLFYSFIVEVNRDHLLSTCFIKKISAFGIRTPKQSRIASYECTGSLILSCVACIQHTLLLYFYYSCKNTGCDGIFSIGKIFGFR